ncbi:MAG: DUF2905 domain-containing protein [Calditrichia bacterium]
MENSPFAILGKYVVISGIIIVLFGLLMIFANKIPFIGKLPGDIIIHKKNFTFYFPITTLIILNLILLLISYLFRK